LLRQESQAEGDANSVENFAPRYAFGNTVQFLVFNFLRAAL
jgi:hypothetical protein